MINKIPDIFKLKLGFLFAAYVEHATGNQRSKFIIFALNTVKYTRKLHFWASTHKYLTNIKVHWSN